MFNNAKEIRCSGGLAIPVCPWPKPDEKDFYTRHSDEWNRGDYLTIQINAFETWLSQQPTLHTNAGNGIYPVGEFKLWGQYLTHEWVFTPVEKLDDWKERFGFETRRFLEHIGPKKQERDQWEYYHPEFKRWEKSIDHKVDELNGLKTRVQPATPEQKGVEQGEEKSKWVKMDDEEENMPPFDVKLLIILGNGDMHIGYFNGADIHGHYFFCDNNDYHYPTHWMPLPEPPII